MNSNFSRSCFIVKGRVSNFWKVDRSAPHILYIAYATQAMINSVKHKELFHRNYLEKYVPGAFFPQTCCCLRFHRKLGKWSGHLTLGLHMFLNTKYANFGLASSVVRTSRVRLRSVSSRRRNNVSLVILQTAAYLITSVISPCLLQSSSLHLHTKYIKHHFLFSLSFKHINSRRNVVQGTHIQSCFTLQ